MPAEIPKGPKSEPEPVPPAPETGATTDEDILRLRSRLDREFAVVTQKLADAEESLVDIEISLRTYETGSRPRIAAVGSAPDASAEKISGRFKAVGDGLSKIRDWVSKPRKEDEPSEGAPGTAPSRGPKDLEERLETALRALSAEIRDRERESSEFDRRLHEAQKELIRARTQEQQAREMQIKIGQTRQLSEDLERRMSVLDEMVRTFEAPAKGEPGARPKPKEAAPAVPRIDERLQNAIDEALKTVAAQEKKVAELEKQVQGANSALVDERARQQRIRAMQLRLRQARHFSGDLQRALGGLASSFDDLSRRAAGLLRQNPVSREATRTHTKPPSPADHAPASKSPGP